MDVCISILPWLQNELFFSLEALKILNFISMVHAGWGSPPPCPGSQKAQWVTRWPCQASLSLSTFHAGLQLFSWSWAQFSAPAGNKQDGLSPPAFLSFVLFSSPFHFSLGLNLSFVAYKLCGPWANYFPSLYLGSLIYKSGVDNSMYFMVWE